MNPERSTPQGFWHRSSEYFVAARCVGVHLAQERPAQQPALNYYGISIELGLKAFLLKRGKTLSQIRSAGHSLTNLLKLARLHKLGREVKLDKYKEAAIRSLEITYASNKLRYVEIGTTSVPMLLYLSRADEEIFAGLDKLCTGKQDSLKDAL